MKLNRNLARTISAVASFLLITALLFTSLRIVMNDSRLHDKEFKRLGVAAAMGMSDEDILASMMRLVDYMEGRVDSVEIEVEVFGRRVMMFNERETLHMIDVRALYMAWRTASYIMAAVAAAMFAVVAFARRREAAFDIAYGFVLASCLFVIVAAVLSAWALIDFSSFWTSFHLLFFDNDLGLLDPLTSRMINMFPAEFFERLIRRFVLLFVPCFAALTACAAAVLGAGVKRRRKNNLKSPENG